MNQATPSPRGHKIAFVINCAVGGLMLALAIVGFILESIFKLQGLAWGFLVTAIICLFVASLSYAKYVSVQKQGKRNQ